MVGNVLHGKEYRDYRLSLKGKILNKREVDDLSLLSTKKRRMYSSYSMTVPLEGPTRWSRNSNCGLEFSRVWIPNYETPTVELWELSKDKLELQKSRLRLLRYLVQGEEPRSLHGERWRYPGQEPTSEGICERKTRRVPETERQD